MSLAQEPDGIYATIERMETRKRRRIFKLLGWAPQMDAEELKVGSTKPTALQMSPKDLQYMESNKPNKVSGVISNTTLWSMSQLKLVMNKLIIK